MKLWRPTISMSAALQLPEAERYAFLRARAEHEIRLGAAVGAPFELTVVGAPKIIRDIVRDIYAGVQMEIAEERASLRIPALARCVPMTCSVGKVGINWAYYAAPTMAESSDWGPFPFGVVGSEDLAWRLCEEKAIQHTSTITPASCRWERRRPATRPSSRRCTAS